MILNKWGCFPITRPSIDLLEDNERAILTKPFVYLRPECPAEGRPVQIWMALPGLEFDGESKPFWYWPVGGGRYQGPGRLAAIIHDEYCHRGRDLSNSPYASGQVHRVYYEAARCAGLHAIRAESRWLGVRSAGPRFARNPGEQQYTLEHLRTLAPTGYAALSQALAPEGLTEETLPLLFGAKEAA